MTMPRTSTIESVPPALPSAARRGQLLPLMWTLARPRAQGGAAMALPAVAFGVTTALLLVVLAGSVALSSGEPDDLLPMYQMLSALAVAILAIPLLSLGAAAARLSARRRDDRLATLRLLGAGPVFVGAVTVLESAIVALAGACVGVLGYLVLIPVIGVIPFRGAPLTAASLVLPVGVVAGTVLAVTLLAALSSVVALTKIIVSPLGVVARTDAARSRILPVLIGVGILGGAVFVAVLRPNADLVISVGIVIGCFAAGIGVLSLIGPWMLSVFARVWHRRARGAVGIIAARGILESPRAAWRQVGSVAVVSFIAVIAGTGAAVVTAAGEAGAGAGGEDVMITDIRTGILITLLIAFIMVACSVGVTQAAAVLDRRDTLVASDRSGVSISVLEAARTRSVMGPLIFVVLLAAVPAAMLTFPLVGAALIFAPMSMAVMCGCFLAGIALVWVSVVATRPVASSVLAAPRRQID